MAQNHIRGCEAWTGSGCRCPEEEPMTALPPPKPPNQRLAAIIGVLLIIWLVLIISYAVVKVLG
jgi:hypothetical protein